jgi:5'-3' exonuclease
MLKKWKFHKTEGIEADDAVGIAAYAVPEDAVIMVHIDKDLNQFRGWHYNYRNKETYYVTEFNGLKSFYTQILTGDRIDNIIGIKGIGAVKAERILKECKTENEMYLAVLEAYNGDSERVLENGQLLWLQREVNQVWQPPQLSTSSGSMQSQTEDGKTISK